MHKRRWAAAALALVVLPMAACSSGPTGSRYASCAEPIAAEPGALPADLPLLPDAEVTDVTQREGFVAVSGVVSDSSVDDLYPAVVDAVRSSGFDILGQENEGFEAEVYFARRREVAGIASLRKGPCPDQVTASVVYDPLETKRGKRVTARTRAAAGG